MSIQFWGGPQCHTTPGSCESNFWSSHRMKNGLDSYGSYYPPTPMQRLVRVTASIEWLLLSRREFLPSSAKKVSATEEVRG
jgi:hypothetical protein